MKTTINGWLLTTRRNWMVMVVGTAVFALAAPAAAQEVPKVQEPEYANSFFLLNSSGSLKPLEHQPVGVAAKSKMLGLGGVGVSYEIQNDHSPIRIEAGAPIEMVVKLDNRDVDPATVVLLYPLTITKGKRQLLISGVSGFISHRSKSDLQSKQTQMVFTKYGERSLKIAPAGPLAPGEYAITVQSRDQQPTAYCFGIDAATK